MVGKVALLLLRFRFPFPFAKNRTNERKKERKKEETPTPRAFPSTWPQFGTCIYMYLESSYSTSITKHKSRHHRQSVNTLIFPNRTNESEGAGWLAGWLVFQA